MDLGYCSRPPKSRTTITLTMPNGTAVVIVPIGLPTDALPTLGNIPKPTQTEPLIEFIPEAGRAVPIARRDSFVTMAKTMSPDDR